MGDPPGTGGFYPTPAQRAAAFDTGFWLGQLKLLLFGLERVREKQISEKEKEGVAQWAADIETRFGFRDVSTEAFLEDPFKFYCQEAKRITHYSDGSLDEISIARLPDKWYPGNGDKMGVVRCAVVFRNTASRMIHVELALQLVYTGKWEPYDPESTDLAQTRRFSFTLKPRGWKKIAVRFPFTRRYREDWVPTLTVPPDEHALITSEYVGRPPGKRGSAGSVPP
jgi:hypothetical protein